MQYEINDVIRITSWPDPGSAKYWIGLELVVLSQQPINQTIWVKPLSIRPDGNDFQPFNIPIVLTEPTETSMDVVIGFEYDYLQNNNPEKQEVIIFKSEWDIY